MKLLNEKISNLKCILIHSLPGRVRIQCYALEHLSSSNIDIKSKIDNLNGINSIHISNITKNLLITYDPLILKEEIIVDSVESIISQYALYSSKNNHSKNNEFAVKERDLHEETMTGIFTKLGITSALIGISLARKYFRTIQVTTRSKLTLNSIGAVYLSYPLIKSAIVSLKENKKPNADALEVMAIMASLFSGRELSSLTILLLHNVAELMTVYAMKKTKNAIRELLSVNDDSVWKLNEDGSLTRKKITEIELDDKIIIHTGEKICVDGIINSGEALIDQSAITGEFMPLTKSISDKVFAGTVIKAGTITVNATAIGDNTAVARIIHMVENAPNRKAAIQNYADKLSEFLIPVNIVLFFGVLAVTKNLGKALNMLVIDYSCGIRLSTVTALTAAINTAARNNVLIKGSNIIEIIAESDTLILDKTGTLTKGEPAVVSIMPLNNSISKQELIEYAAAAEETSNHPMAVAIMKKLYSFGGKVKKHGTINIIPGKGIETKVLNSFIRVGNKRFMNENGIHTHPLKDKVRTLSLAGENVVFISKGKNVIGVLGIRDPLRDNMKKAINRLRIDAKIDDIILLTGDQEQQAEVIANRLGIDRFDYELLPEDKAKTILSIQADGTKVIMVGDGINDAPALAYADVGIAMGKTRTDIAMETADVTIAGDNPLMLPALYTLSKETMGIIKQNFVASIGINTLGLLLGATGSISVFLGALLHNSSTVIVVGNSLRILFYDFNKRKNGR